MNLQQNFPHPPKILIADDDIFTRDLLKAYLVNAGCEVTGFPNGAEALAAIHDGYTPDLALLDIQMPRMDGLTLCQRMKSAPETQFIPVIIVTALDADDEKLNAIESGADDFITKPFNSVILLTRVRSLLRIKRLHDELESRNILLKQVLTRYVDEEVANIILTDPERHLKLGGESRYVTVLFADLRGFTRFTESHPAEKVVETLNIVFTALTDIIYKNGGTFDKYLGDAIMAFYGAPISYPDDGLRALRTALDMQACFTDLKAQPSRGIMAPLGLGIGIHSGEAIVGNIGSERVMDYTVIGDTANTARRLQESARPGEILISQSTLKYAPRAKIRELTVQALPGKLEPVAIYSFKGLRE